MLPPRRIVVHHPDPDFRSILLGALRGEFGPSVPLLPAGSCDEVMALARTTAPEVIILPICEPGSTAVEILAQLQAEFPQHSWGVVVLLPDERPDSLRRGMEAMRAGALDYTVGHPPQAAALARAVRHATLRSRVGRTRRGPAQAAATPAVRLPRSAGKRG